MKSICIPHKDTFPHAFFNDPKLILLLFFNLYYFIILFCYTFNAILSHGDIYYFCAGIFHE